MLLTIAVACLLVLGAPPLAFSQSAETELAWQGSSAEAALPDGAVSSMTTKAIETVCGGPAADGLVIGSIDESGRCEVGYQGLAWMLSTFDVLTGSSARWETPVEEASAAVLPVSRMVLAGYGADGAPVHPCRAPGPCRRWNASDDCHFDSAPVGHIETDPEGNAACMIADSDFGTCVCAAFDVLVAQ